MFALGGFLQTISNLPMTKNNAPTPPPIIPRRSNFLLSKPNNSPPPQEEIQTEQAFQPEPEPPAAAAAPRTESEIQTEQAFQPEPKPEPSVHRKHPRFGYLVKICNGNAETADRLAQLDGVETAIDKLLRDRH